MDSIKTGKGEANSLFTDTQFNIQTILRIYRSYQDLYGFHKVAGPWERTFAQRMEGVLQNRRKETGYRGGGAGEWQGE